MNSLLQETLLSTKHISTALLLTRSPPHTQKAKSPASATLFTNDQETERIIAGFENPAEVRNQGIMVGGKHYIVIRADGGAVYAKNVRTVQLDRNDINPVEKTSSIGRGEANERTE